MEKQRLIELVASQAGFGGNQRNTLLAKLTEFARLVEEGARGRTPSTVCPRCNMAGVVLAPWGAGDLAAICRHVRRCGYRRHIPGGASMSSAQVGEYLRAHPGG